MIEPKYDTWKDIELGMIVANNFEKIGRMPTLLYVSTEMDEWAADKFVRKLEEKKMNNNSNYVYGMPSADRMTFNQTKKDPYLVPGIAKVIYNPPATIILWTDKTKTVVKCWENDIYDPEKGFAMAVIKKLCGNDSALFHKLFKTWTLESKDAPKESIPPINISIDGFDPAKQLKDMINRIFGVGGSNGN